jgi:hypothetical protein
MTGLSTTTSFYIAVSILLLAPIVFIDIYCVSPCFFPTVAVAS